VRKLVWNLKDDSRDMAFLIHDNDTKFISSYDPVFSSEGIEVLHTPYQALRANAFAERWVCSVREECLDHIRVLDENHLRRSLREYGEDYNHARPHQGIGQRFPISVQRRDQKVQYVDEIFLGASSTITTDSLHLRFLQMDRLFTP